MPTSSIDAETLDLMSRAFEAAWEEVGFALANKDADLTALRTMMAARIMAAVHDGERDFPNITLSCARGGREGVLSGKRAAPLLESAPRG